MYLTLSTVLEKRKLEENKLSGDSRSIPRALQLFGSAIDSPYASFISFLFHTPKGMDGRSVGRAQLRINLHVKFDQCELVFSIAVSSNLFPLSRETYTLISL